MAASPPPLSALLKKATIDDHEEVLQTCNAALKQYKGNLEAQHIKVVALLKLDRHDDALRVLGDSSDELKRSAGLEYAYALYKVGELEKALEISNKLGENRGANHVQAQAVGITAAFGSGYA
jgi:signal recognition particle subunit SRP72